MKSISLFEVVEKFPLYQKGLKAIEPFKEQYLGLTNFANSHPHISKKTGEKSIRKLAAQGMIGFRKSGNHTLYSVYDILHYHIALDAFFEVYVNAKEFFLAIGYGKVSKNLFPHTIEPKLKGLYKKGHIKIIELEYPINFYRLYIKKSDIHRFIGEHISLAMASKEANVMQSTLLQSWMKVYPHAPIVLSPSCNFMFLKRKEWDPFLKTRKKEGYITKESVAKQLGITSNNLEKVCKEYKISFILKEELGINTKHLTIESLSFLIKEQKDKWEEFKTLYYTSKEAAKELGILVSSLPGLKEKLNPIPVPLLIGIKIDGYNFRTVKQSIYPKELIQTYIKNRNEEERASQFFQTLEGDPFQQFQTYLQEFNFKFNSKGMKTQKYWYHYVRQKLHSSQSSDRARKGVTRVFINASILLITLTEKKKSICIHQTS